MTAHSTNKAHNVIPARSRLYQGFFGRIMPDLPPWAPPFPQGSNVSDAEADAFFENFVQTHMRDPGETSLDSGIPAGYTYFGQFIDHDITFDPASSLMRQNDPDMLNNFRTPRLDLDNVYLDGPEASPHLYEKVNGRTIGRFLIGQGENANEPDLPRNSAQTALIGDPRNDENIIVSQLQLTFLKFHNRMYDMLIAGGAENGEAFDEARRIVTWTYQYIVWNDFLKRILQENVWESILKLVEDPSGVHTWDRLARFYNWRSRPYMPVEFSVAAYRFGHSLVRNGYQVNIITGFGNEITIFDLVSGGPDLRGGRTLPNNFSLQWDWFLELPSSSGPFPQSTRKIDPLLSEALFAIPAGPGGNNALAALNLKRGWRMDLPAGTAVAQHMGIAPISVEPEEEALWFYLLKEAGTLGAGVKLGPVGSVIVGEVFSGLFAGDPNSFFSLRPTWTPSQESLLMNLGPWKKDEDDPSTNNLWELGDIIRIAQMPESGTQVTNLIDSGNFTPSI